MRQHAKFTPFETFYESCLVFLELSTIAHNNMLIDTEGTIIGSLIRLQLLYSDPSGGRDCRFKKRERESVLFRGSVSLGRKRRSGVPRPDSSW